VALSCGAFRFSQVPFHFPVIMIRLSPLSPCSEPFRRLNWNPGKEGVESLTAFPRNPLLQPPKFLRFRFLQRFPSLPFLEVVP